jgi:hypothetical protein
MNWKKRSTGIGDPGRQKPNIVFGKCARNVKRETGSVRKDAESNIDW